MVLILIPCLLTAQDIDSLLAVLKSYQDEDWFLLLNDNSKYHIVYVQTGFENNTYFTGRDIGVDQYNMYIQTVYNYRGFTAAAAGVIYSEFEPHWYTSMLSLGYQKGIISPLPLDLSVSYDRYFFHDSDDSLLSTFPNSLNLGVVHTSPYWGVLLDYSLLFGTETSSQFSGALYTKFTLLRWKGGNKCILKPQMSFVFGSEETAFLRLPGSRRPPISSTRFGLLNTEITIPLICYAGDVDMSLAYRYNIPRSLDAETEYAATSLFSLSLGYMFGFRGK